MLCLEPLDNLHSVDLKLNFLGFNFSLIYSLIVLSFVFQAIHSGQEYCFYISNMALNLSVPLSELDMLLSN